MTPEARFVQNLLNWIVRIAVVAAAIASLIWISGCVIAAEPYWVKTHAPVAVTDTRFVDYPCGQRIHGCFQRTTGVIELRTGMNALLLECTLSHERRHAAGYSHRAGPHYSIDCGDGTTYTAMSYR